MNVLKMLTANAPAGGNQSLFQIINGLGLTTNLKLCLDAGDSASYDPAVQTDKWLDTSGLGYDFFRGTGAGSQASDPTFNGSAGGLSSNEYWSFDGGDYFLYDTAVETWMNNLHKDGAVLTILSVYYSVAAGSIERVFATRPSGATGVIWTKSSTNKIQYSVFNTSTQVLAANGTVDLTDDSWNIISISLNEPLATNNILLKVNNTSVETLSGTYSSPSAANLSGTPAIGALASGVNPIASGARIACLAVWEGVALSSANLTSLHDAIKGRFGL